jgi:SAM-dependent methyltransferase
MTQPIDFDIVADLYDSYVVTGLDIQFFLDETKDFEDEILELMCGTGRISIQLLKAGRKLWCVDYSQKMLDVFNMKVQHENYPVRIINMDVTNLDLKERFGMALLPFHSLSEILTSDGQLKAIKSISNHLRDKGIFICTLQNPIVRLKSADGKIRKIGEFRLDESHGMNVSYLNRYDQTKGIVTGYQKYEIFDNSGKLIEERILDISFRPLSDSQFRCFIRETDLEIIEQYGDYNKGQFDEETSNFMIYKLIKKSTKA